MAERSDAEVTHLMYVLSRVWDEYVVPRAEVQESPEVLSKTKQANDALYDAYDAMAQKQNGQ